MATPTWDTLTLLGVGLLGGSIGLAARQRGIVRRVVGYGRRPESLESARKLGAIDEWSTELDAAVGPANLVIVCTPIESVAQYVCQTLERIGPDALVTDVGSTKAGIVAEVARRLGAPADAARRARFIPSHPLAGGERAGVQFSQADLFEGRTVIVTPSGEETATHRVAVQSFWRSLGARVVEQTPVEHDQIVAAISHVPHLAASALAASTPAPTLPFAAAGWMDTTRVAAGDVELWRQIFAANRANVIESLDAFIQALVACREALQRGDDDTLVHWLQAGKRNRDAVGN